VVRPTPVISVRCTGPKGPLTPVLFPLRPRISGPFTTAFPQLLIERYRGSRRWGPNSYFPTGSPLGPRGALGKSPRRMGHCPPHELIRQSLAKLSDIHPFFGMDYLVFKQGKIPVGRKTDFPINRNLEDFLRLHYKPDLKSTFYFQPFKTSSSAGRWLSHKYPHSGAQKTRTSGRLSAAFLHDRNTDQWGWSQDYMQVLRSQLNIDKVERIPVFWIAVWLYRDKNWPTSTNASSVVGSSCGSFTSPQRN
jgi:hypothetical protein